MEQIILIFHFVVAVGLIGLILLQQGKGAEAGASFGSGASQTVFGSGGGWNFFSKTTAILSTIFFVTSVSLALIAKNKTVAGDLSLKKLMGSVSNVSTPNEIIMALGLKAMTFARASFRLERHVSNEVPGGIG